MQDKTSSLRAFNERRHGRKLAGHDPDRIWGWAGLAGQSRAKRRSELITHKAQLSPSKRVLEIGCGSGEFTVRFAETGADITGVDISPELLELAREKTSKYRNVKLLEKRFEESDVGGPFDAIIGSSVLHHLEIIPALFRIFDLLKPGGIMSFAEPNMLNPQILIQKNVPLIKTWLGDSPDETAFFRWSLWKILARASFRGIEITPFDWLHPATPAFLVQVIRRTGQLLEAIPLIREFAGSLLITAQKP